MMNNLAVFVTEQTTLIAIHDETQLDWVQLSWVHDRDFLSFLSALLETKSQPKIKMNCDNAQIPHRWLKGEHYLFTYHEWVSICQNFIRSFRLPEGGEEFAYFRRISTQESKKRLLTLTEELTGLFRAVDIDIYVVISTDKPHWSLEKEGKTSIENLKEYWDKLPKIEDVLQEIMDGNKNETDIEQPEDGKPREL